MLRIRVARFVALAAAGAWACSGTQQPAPEPQREVVAIQVPKIAEHDEDDASSAAEPEPGVILETDAGVAPSDDGGLAQADESTDAGVFGILGVIGDGGGGIGFIGGFGVGSGRLAGSSSHGVAVGATKVKGSLDKNIIRRIVRRHVAKFRYCYEKQLVADPKLTAKATPRFTIGLDGSVTAASLSPGSGNAELDACLLTVIRAMQFPSPKGGIVIVSYPLVFQSAP